MKQGITSHLLSTLCPPTFRHILRKININVSYLEGTAAYIDPKKDQTIVVKPVECDGNNVCGIEDHHEIPYDRLIYAIGAKTNTFGIPGVEEHCNFLKQVRDARKIRAAIVNCFERASFPELTEAEKTQILTFAVIGAGPSGIEFAAELRDFIEQDGPRYYPGLLKNVRIKVIEGSNTVLAPFHKSLQKEAIEKLNSQTVIKDPEVKKLLPPRLKLTQLMLGSFVKEITEDSIHLTDGSQVPYDMAVWAAGNAPMTLTLDLIEELGIKQSDQQGVARGRVATDPWLRAVGCDGSIFVIGDASCVVHNQVPATGQVASQQGEYIARLLNKQYDVSPSTTSTDGVLPPPVRVPNTTQQSISESIASLSTKTSDYAKPFQFLNLGILAYTRRDTLTGPDTEPITATGKIGSELWKTVYLWKQVSWRNRIMVVGDWFNRQIFGRDITHLD
jgi:NADH:ubiquinone reductase (non-electrogenic)